MYGIELLMDEHKNILRMATVMRNASLEVLNGGEVNATDFKEMVDFVRNYADGHHHKKEENVLFVYMKKELGKIAENLITHGMLVEHDLGRLHMTELTQALVDYEQGNTEAKLDIITNATAYTYLIKRHISKEDEVVFTYGEKNLKDKSKESVNQQSKELEDSAAKAGVQEKYINILNKLEQKYNKSKS